MRQHDSCDVDRLALLLDATQVAITGKLIRSPYKPWLHQDTGHIASRHVASDSFCSLINDRYRPCRKAGEDRMTAGRLNLNFQ